MIADGACGLGPERHVQRRQRHPREHGGVQLPRGWPDPLPGGPGLEESGSELQPPQ